MTAIPLSQGVEPSLHSLLDQTSKSGIVDYDTTAENDDDYKEKCRNDALIDAANIKPGIFITGPESWPANLQLKVRNKPFV